MPNLKASCESLLLTDNDRDYLSHKLAQKIAFLLSDKGKERYNLFKTMKKLYGKRSRLIHSGKKDINQFDLIALEGIFNGLIIKMCGLSIKYDKMNQSNEKGKSGVDDYINKLIFNFK